MTHYHGYDSSHETWSWNCAETKPCRARIFPPLRAPAHRVSRQIPLTCTFIRCLFMTYWHWLPPDGITIAEVHCCTFAFQLFPSLSLSSSFFVSLSLLYLYFLCFGLYFNVLHSFTKGDTNSFFQKIFTNETKQTTPTDILHKCN